MNPKSLIDAARKEVGVHEYPGFNIHTWANGYVDVWVYGWSKYTVEQNHDKINTLWHDL